MLTRQFEFVRRRPGRRAEPQLEGRVVDVGGRADKAVVDARADVHRGREGGEEDVGGSTVERARRHWAGGLPVCRAHAVRLPEEAVVQGRFKGLSLALQGGFKGQRLALVGVEGGGLDAARLDRPAQGNGGEGGGCND